MDELSININIAGRTYPLEVESKDESTVRAAGKMIQEKLQEYADTFSLRDNQDALAMFALELATEYQKLIKKQSITDEQFQAQLNEVNELLDEVKLS